MDSDDENERTEAVYYFLWSCAFHQYTLYPATPLVILFVIEALHSQQLAERDDGIDEPMKCGLMEFLFSCAERGQRAICGKPFPAAPTIEDAILSGKSLYSRYANDSYASVKAHATWLLSFCEAQTNNL